MGGTLFTTLAAWSGCAAARRYLDRTSRREEDYLGGRVRLKSMWNEGAAFSLPIPAESLPLASAAALGLLWTRRRRCPLGTGLILGGGLSNLQERLTEGRVYDYLQFPRAPRPLDRYVFNLADLCVFAGGGLCLLRGGKPPRPS
nr:signal peptidase II [uncultured Oscillibacter sp.]